MLDTVVMSGDDVCCSVVFGTLDGVFVFSVMWSELLMSPPPALCNLSVRTTVKLYIFDVLALGVSLVS